MGPTHDLTFLHYAPGTVLGVSVEDMPACWASGAGWCSETCEALALEALRRSKMRPPPDSTIRATQARTAMVEMLTSLALN